MCALPCRWMAKFKAHLREGITMLQKGQAIHTRMGRGARKPADKKAYTGESEKVVIGLVLKTPRGQPNTKDFSSSFSMYYSEDVGGSTRGNAFSSQPNYFNSQGFENRSIDKYNPRTGKYTMVFIYLP